MRLLLAPLFACAVSAPGFAQHDWLAFRGGNATASSATEVVRTWSSESNILWQKQLPGPGTSSPIVVGTRVFVTCWSGYALSREEPGDIAKLKRHLLCFDRESGKELWQRSVAPVESEDTYDGRMATHGYASSTPVSDGKNVFVQFGKSGVFAYTLAGEQLWKADVGKSSSKWKTGSGTSPSLWKDMLLVNAADESLSIRGLDKKTGEERWKIESPKLDQCYGRPLVRDTTLGPTMFVALLGEIWAIDPATGKERWKLETVTNGALAPSIVPGGDFLVSFGGQTKKRSYAIRTDKIGEDDSRVLWSSRYGAYVTSPLLHDGHLYWANDQGVAMCARADNGEIVYRERLDGRFYSSPVRAGDAIYYVSRSDGTYVLPAKPEFEILAHNVIDGDTTMFDATPALSGGRIFLRSRSSLYCIGSK